MIVRGRVIIDFPPPVVNRLDLPRQRYREPQCFDIIDIDVSLKIVIDMTLIEKIHDFLARAKKVNATSIVEGCNHALYSYDKYHVFPDMDWFDSVDNYLYDLENE